MSISNRIGILGEQLGLTQESFAQTLNCIGMRISRYKSGATEPKWLMGNESTPMFEDGALLLNDRESVSQRLKTIRKEKHLMHKCLVDNIAVQQSTISKVEIQQTFRVRILPILQCSVGEWLELYGIGGSFRILKIIRYGLCVI